MTEASKAMAAADEARKSGSHDVARLHREAAKALRAAGRRSLAKLYTAAARELAS